MNPNGEHGLDLGERAEGKKETRKEGEDSGDRIE
jgi:hypothetical protein